MKTKKQTKKTIFDSLTCISDIIFTMVRGLQNKWVVLNMNSYGGWGWSYSSNQEICYGCAATNTLCELMQAPFPKENIYGRENRLSVINYDTKFKDLQFFETSIDSLRRGNFLTFLEQISNVEDLSFKINKKKIENLYIKYPYDLSELGNDFTKKELQTYIEFANYLKSYNL